MSTITFDKLTEDQLRDHEGLVRKLLPEQGSIEVQHDQGGKEHAWHTHPTDETLVVLDGSVRFYSEQGARVCERGDVINLPVGVRHGSVALDGGAVYLIAMERKHLAAEDAR